MTDSGENIKLDTVKPERQRPPFSGAIVRLAAFILDGAVLWMVGWVLNRSFRPVMLSLNPALPWLGYLVAYLYFIIGEGPLGKGRTTGKFVIAHHVVTRDGAVPAWSSAAKRAILKTFVFFIFTNTIFDSLILPIGATYPFSIVLSILQVTAITLAITLGMAISVHPHKRGWHDLLAGTYVTGDPTPSVFHEALAEQDVVVERRLALNMRLTGVFFVLATSIMLIRPLSIELKPEMNTRFKNLVDLNNAAPLPNLRMVQAVYPDPQYKKLFSEQVEQLRASAVTRKEPVPTTDSLRQTAFYDGESIAVQAVPPHGPLTVSDAISPAMIANANKVREQAWRHWESVAVRGEKLPARQFRLLLVEPLRFIVYNGTEWKAVIEGPADPAAGPLTARDLTKTPARSTTETTQSTPAAQPTHGPGTPKP